MRCQHVFHSTYATSHRENTERRTRGEERGREEDSGVCNIQKNKIKTRETKSVIRVATL